MSHIQPPRPKQSKSVYTFLFSWTPVERLYWLKCIYQTHFMETVRSFIKTSNGMFRIAYQFRVEIDFKQLIFTLGEKRTWQFLSSESQMTAFLSLLIQPLDTRMLKCIQHLRFIVFLCVCVFEIKWNLFEMNASFK